MNISVFQMRAGYRRRYSESLMSGRSGNWVLVEARFFAPLKTGTGTHTSFCTMGNGSLSREYKYGGRDVKHPPLSSAEVKERLELHLYSPLGIYGLFYGELYLYRLWNINVGENNTGNVRIM